MFPEVLSESLGTCPAKVSLKREGCEATSSLLETETMTGQRINADERNMHENQYKQWQMTCSCFLPPVT